MQNRVRKMALVASAGILFLVAGCGGGDSSDEARPDPVATAEQPISTPTEQAASTPSSLTLVARDILFDSTQLEAKAGTITLELDNQDGGVPHNLHVHMGSDASGESVGQTELEAGPVTQALTLDLNAGDYFYVCDAHPTTMTGVLKVV